jgi:hypothetical protein
MDRSENIFKAEYTQPQIEFDSDDYLELFEDLSSQAEKWNLVPYPLSYKGFFYAMYHSAR